MSKHDVSKVTMQYIQVTPKTFKVKSMLMQFKNIPTKQLSFVNKHIFGNKLEQPITEHYQFDFDNEGLVKAAILYSKQNKNNLDSLEKNQRIIPVSLPANR